MNLPVSIWWNAAHSHPAVARALQFDARQPFAAYALAPFRYAKVEGRHLVLAAWPAPRIGEGPERIKQIAAWEPTTDTSWMLGRATREFGDGEDVYHLPRALFADWAEARLVFALKRQVERLERQYNFNRRVFPQTPEGDLLPGYLVLDGARREHVESALAKSLELHSSYRRL